MVNKPRPTIEWDIAMTRNTIIDLSGIMAVLRNK